MHNSAVNTKRWIVLLTIIIAVIIALTSIQPAKREGSGQPQVSPPLQPTVQAQSTAIPPIQDTITKASFGSNQNPNKP